MSEPVVTLRKFFEHARDGQLTAVRCTGCGELAIPPKQFCPACGTRGWEPVALSGDGVVETFTIIRIAPRQFVADVPYAIGAVRLSEGVSMLGRIVDVPLDRISVGLRVRFRPLIGEDRTSVGFSPAA
jgi:uncharacterized OB-fold protein